MSWQAFRDNLINSKNVTKAAIVGLDGNIWTQSDDMALSQPEAKAIANGMSGNTDTLRDKGVLIGTVKYFLLQSDDQQVQAKKGNDGLSVAKANTCFVIGTYVEGITPGNCRNSVEKMRDYLTSQNF